MITTVKELRELLEQFPDDMQVGKLSEDEAGFIICTSIETVSIVFGDVEGFITDENGTALVESEDTKSVLVIN